MSIESIDRPIIHFHIPKTAGTSLRAAFVNYLGPDKVAVMMRDRRMIKTEDLPLDAELIYKARTVARNLGMLTLFSTGLNMVNSRAASRQAFNISALNDRGLDLATGHFLPDDISEPISHLPRTTVLREPLDRALSHYSHWRDGRGGIWWHKGGVKFTEKVSFEEFASDPMITNYQVKNLGNLSFDAIGATCHLPEFLEEIGLDPITDVPILNPGVNSRRNNLDQGFVREFENLNALDYELYERTLAMYN